MTVSPLLRGGSVQIAPSILSADFAAQERIATQDVQRKIAALDEKLAALSKRALTAAR